MEDNGKYYANRGVERNKKPLKNIIYKIDIRPLEKINKKYADDPVWLAENEKYKFKDEGYIILMTGLQEKNGNRMGWNGNRTPEHIKKLLGEKQWSKFCQGKREFIIQRRIDGNNVKKR